MAIGQCHVNTLSTTTNIWVQTANRSVSDLHAKIIHVKTWEKKHRGAHYKNPINPRELISLSNHQPREIDGNVPFLCCFEANRRIIHANNGYNSELWSLFYIV
jgi:hypothetical protein